MSNNEFVFYRQTTIDEYMRGTHEQSFLEAFPKEVAIMQAQNSASLKVMSKPLVSSGTVTRTKGSSRTRRPISMAKRNK